MRNKVIQSPDLTKTAALIGEIAAGRHLLLTIDESVPALAALSALALPAADTLPLPGGEQVKTLDTVARIWNWLHERGAGRDSVLAIAGGGSLTDAAGFAASTFKRGMDTITVPTTLLGAVDASIGGKTAINFGGVKNEIGTFHIPAATVICPEPWRSLPERELLSGFGEVLKTSLLIGPEAVSSALAAAQEERLADASLAAACARFKTEITTRDPYDRGDRQALNLGHTAGHALEALLRGRGVAITHGHAVAAALVAALVISSGEAGLDSMWLYRVAAAVRDLYPPFPLSCDDYPELLRLMEADKKNPDPRHIAFTLLEAPGRWLTRRVVPPDTILTALDITRDLLSLP